MSQVEVKGHVRQFYDHIGWQLVGDFYQNARYEDLRPVSAEYIHRCHLRVKQVLKPEGAYFLDAGSGPIQYPEYLLYSEGYHYRVCADLSIVALKEARKRIGLHGLFVVADVANLPFKSRTFEGIVSLHTFHHLPHTEHKKAYCEMMRILSPGCSAVVVNGWTDSPLMRKVQPVVRVMERLGKIASGIRKFFQPRGMRSAVLGGLSPGAKPTGTFINKQDAAGLRQELAGDVDFEIRVWRSVSVRFLRAVIHQMTGGKLWLRLLFSLEERFPVFFGEKGQYPLIVIRKNE
jgi:SAM-dependent methyltransferase